MGAVAISCTALSLIIQALLSSAFADSRAATVSINQKCIPIIKETYGVNTIFVRSPTTYNNPLVEHFFVKHNITTIRYPGGTASTSLDWETGLASCNADCTCDPVCPDFAQDTRDRKGCPRYYRRCNEISEDTSLCASARTGHDRASLNIRRFRRSGKFELSELERLIFSTVWDGNFIYVVNVCGKSPESSSRLAKKFVDYYQQKDPAIDVTDKVRFEMGNELYFDKYSYCTPNSSVYDKIASQHALEIKKVNPNFKVSVAINSPTILRTWGKKFTNEYVRANPTKQIRKTLRWNPLFPKNNFTQCTAFENTNVSLYDAVSLHSYPKPTDAPAVGENYTTEESYFVGLTNWMTNKFEQAVKVLTDEFHKPVWWTEYHFNSTSGTYRKSFYAGMYRTIAKLYLVSQDRVKVANFHSLQGLFGMFELKDNSSNPCLYAEDYNGPELTGTMSEKDEQFAARVNIVKSLEMSLSVMGPIFKECSASERISINGETFGEEIMGVLFYCVGDMKRLVLVNKRANEYIVDLSGVTSDPNEGIMADVYSRNPENILDYNLEKVESVGSITVPGYSIMSVRFYLKGISCKESVPSTAFPVCAN